MHPLQTAWETVTREFDAAQAQAAQAARSQTTHELNQVVRRLQQYGAETEWVAAVLDGAAAFAHQIALFSVAENTARLRGQRDLGLPDDFSCLVGSAAAFASAIAGKDTVVALRTASEVTPELAVAGSGPVARAYIIPISNGPRVVALLFAAVADSMDPNGLELIAGVASMVLERQSNASRSSLVAAPAPAASAKGSRAANFPVWADLDETQRGLHFRAQRFARVKVAEMQLAKPEASRAGREQANLYVFLKKEIDAARDAYRRQFMTVSTMVDYLHMELVRTAADNDELKLGADYPGQLV